MTVTTSSYVRHRAGHCALREHSTQTKPCWGQVKIVDEVSSGEEESDGIYLLACEGHFAKVRDGYRAAYKEEKHERKDT